METLLELDKQLFLWLNALGCESFDSLWMFITNKRSSIPLYIFLLYYAYVKLGQKRFFIILISAVSMIAFTDQITNLFKYSFMRLRPCFDPETMDIMRLVKESCGGQFGYFSGHASNSFALATLFYWIFKPLHRLWYLLFLWALVVAYSRIYIGVHFPLDIISGAIFGLAAGTMFYFIYRFFEKRWA
ncbi:MAG: phosphatase PAP2 family protein [Flavobacteriaceae bacterium]|nr:phosphatase PAP2 family protein [Flavobacteriaceae bacterium]MDG2314802.1 phosphatase PAP2 family protein [Flavobacteriaceae bacterium]